MPARLTPERIKLIRRLARDGYTYEQIAAQTGHHYHTVSKYAKGLTKRSQQVAQKHLGAMKTEDLTYLRQNLAEAPCPSCGGGILCLASQVYLLCPHCHAQFRRGGGA